MLTSPSLVTPASTCPSLTVYGNKFENRFVVIISFDDTEGRLEKEIWAYPVISFIAEIGGSLSLFIGVSFLSVWDFWEYLFDKYKQYRN